MNHLKQLNINKLDEWHEIAFNKESPYIFLDSIDINDQIEKDIIHFTEIRCKVKYPKSSKESGIFDTNENSRQDKIIINREVELNEVESLYIKVTNTESSALNHPIILNYKTINLIEDTNSTINFKSHLSSSLNTKILFSAPFGEGKSTFLNYFFEQNKKEYEVFKVYPVNYSVANNEDIFRYIKTDILFQLFGKEVDFEKEKISRILSTQQFFLSNPKKVLSSVLKIALGLKFPNLGFIKAIENLEEIINKLEEYNKEANKGDEQKAREYLAEVYEKEGSIYEDNFYTQLIRQLVEQLKINSGKKTVLVIEDLDRMDPEHIFRILNVISAHYDAYAQYDDEYHNKFGFDKIIIVCHIENIKNIFEHRYGEKTDFKGYINKFYSSQIYKFDYRKVSNIIIDEYINNLERWNFTHSLNILKALVNAKVLSLRDIIKLKPILSSYESLNFKKREIDIKFNQINFLFTEGYYTLILYILVEYLGGSNTLKLKILQQNNFHLSKSDKINFIIFLLAALAEDKTLESKLAISKDKVYSFNLENANRSIQKAINIKINNQEATDDMLARDFKEILIRNIEMFENI